MSVFAFWIAASLSALWLLVHLFIGGRQIAAPLLAAPDLPKLVSQTQYLCWHFTSVGIAAIALTFGWAAWTGVLAYAVTGTGLALGFSIVGIGLVIALKAKHSLLPQGWLFVPVAALGVWGLLA